MMMEKSLDIVTSVLATVSNIKLNFLIKNLSDHSQANPIQRSKISKFGCRLYFYKFLDSFSGSFIHLCTV